MNSWISAARPRTLPLALSSIFLGSFLAYAENKFNLTIFILACITTIALQVLSNFANDYGDTQNGADNANRVGPQRAVQSGEISAKQMWRAIIITAIFAFVSGCSLLAVSFLDKNWSDFITFLVIGLLCIVAAYAYTAGKSPYGYVGLGDISVFIFFGIVGVMGSYYLYTKTWNWMALLPATSVGLFSAGVLNINNIRDIESDRAAGKRTIPARFGRFRANAYHWFLLIVGMGCALVYTFYTPSQSLWYMFTFILFVLNGRFVTKLSNPDSQLKHLSLSTLVFSLAFGLALIW